jgi:DNA-binding protein WhiA
LRGAFLGGGSVNKPEGDYHLELIAANVEFAETLVRLLKYFSLPVGLTERKNANIVYLKHSNAIVDFLKIIGTQEALVEFENVREVKQMRNKVNRLVNCETANLQKTVNAALRQVERIMLIDKVIGLSNLPPALREAAMLRLAHPEATLAELVDAAASRVGRSGMNHRLRKLEEIANKLGDGDSDENS